MELKIAQLRKLKGISQQELADYLGVTFQAVSKWETKSTLPDITLLPEIAKYFQVSVDEVLGLVPIRNLQYIPRNTDDREQWEKRKHVIQNDRQFFWNEDYLRFLVNEVWKIDKPMDVIEFCCCDGDLGRRLMDLLPEGSTYTGVDSKAMVKEAKENFQGKSYKTVFFTSDIYQFHPKKQYDMSICQASLRHMNQPLRILETMKNSVKDNGLVVSIEINREIENVGLYVDGMEYDHLCTSFDWRKLWLTELEKEGRDYAIGVRVPFYMKQIGLREVDVRMNDKVSYVTPEHDDYRKLCDALKSFRGWKIRENESINEAFVEFFMSRGYKRSEVEKLHDYQREMAQFMEDNREKLSFLLMFGFFISYGRR